MFLGLYTKVQSYMLDLSSRMKDEEGATALEYALLVAFIALVVIVGIKFLGGKINDQFNGAGDKL